MTHIGISDDKAFFNKTFNLYYKVDGVFNKVELVYQNYTRLMSKSTQSVSFSTSSSYAYKVFYSVNSEDSLKLLKLFADNEIEEIRVRHGDKDIRLTFESRFKLDELVDFYKNVVRAGFDINNTDITTKDNSDTHEKDIEKEQSKKNILNLLFS